MVASRAGEFYEQHAQSTYRATITSIGLRAYCLAQCAHLKWITVDGLNIVQLRRLELSQVHRPVFGHKPSVVKGQWVCSCRRLNQAKHARCGGCNKPKTPNDAQCRCPACPTKKGFQSFKAMFQHLRDAKKHEGWRSHHPQEFALLAQRAAQYENKHSDYAKATRGVPCPVRSQLARITIILLVLVSYLQGVFANGFIQSLF